MLARCFRGGFGMYVDHVKSLLLLSDVYLNWKVDLRRVPKYQIQLKKYV